jgi:hypothetical protein
MNEEMPCFVAIVQKWLKVVDDLNGGNWVLAKNTYVCAVHRQKQLPVSRRQSWILMNDLPPTIYK